MLGEEAALLWQGTANARGDVQKPSQAGLVGRVRNTWGFAFGYDPTNGIKSSIHYKPDRYTRRSCAERCVFTPGDLPRVHKD